MAQEAKTNTTVVIAKNVGQLYVLGSVVLTNGITVLCTVFPDFCAENPFQAAKIYNAVTGKEIKKETINSDLNPHHKNYARVSNGYNDYMRYLHTPHYSTHFSRCAVNISGKENPYRG